MERWFVYVALCADDTLYTGVARDVAARIAAHNRGRGARYTRGRAPLRVLAARSCTSRGEALRLELRVKALARRDKLAVVSSKARFAALARASRLAR